jgi:polyhydroxyalkanoate synthesis regulator phasin
MDDNTTPTPTPTSGSKRATTIGVAAGLLAGGAIGLVATVPSLTSAASDDGSDAVVALQDDTDETTGETTDETTETEERPEAGERLREVLQDLVDDGTITESQADAVAEHLVENRPERDGRVKRRVAVGRHVVGTAVAEVLGIDTDTLRSELEDGNSIADIAEANGVDVQTVIDALVADAESRLDTAVERGLDEDRAATRLERLTERIEDGVHRSRDTDG